MDELADHVGTAHRLREYLPGETMDTVEDFRLRYARTDDDDLRRLLAIEPCSLTPEALQALGEEAERRGLRGAMDPPRPDPLDSIDWPAAPVPHTYAKAPIFTRFLAHFVDGIIAFLPFAVAMFFVVFRLVWGRGAFATPAAVGLFLWGIYYCFAKDGFEGGQSFGKKMFNLRVVNVTTNEPCSTGESAIRAVDLFLLQLIPLVGWLIEPIVAMASEDGRCLGDRAAGTQVIDANQYQSEA